MLTRQFTRNDLTQTAPSPRPASLVVIGILSLLFGLVSVVANGAGIWFIGQVYSRSIPPTPPCRC
jgi:hypothetical protein